MTQIGFPSSPSNGDSHELWVYDGTLGAWTLKFDAPTAYDSGDTLGMVDNAYVQARGYWTSATGGIEYTGGVSINGSAKAATETSSVSGNVTLDFVTYQNFVLTLTGAVTLDNPTTEAVGQSGFIVFKQDGTGGHSVSTSSDYLTAGGSGLTLSTGASSIDMVPYVVSASNQILLGTPQLAFA